MLFFYVPTVTQQQNTPEMISAWVGLGGKYGYPLNQAGVLQSHALGLNPANFAWYESYPSSLSIVYCPTNNPHATTPCAIAPGDRMQVQVLYTQYYYVGDGTQGWYFSVQNGGGNANQGTAEWVVEDSGCPNAELMKFQPITFYGMGDTEWNGTYTGPYWQTYDNHYLKACVSPYHVVADDSPLQYDTTYGPPDDSGTIYWEGYY
jgi:hypothetical protein